MNSKSADLQEAPLVALLSLFAHPLIPDMFMGIPGGLAEIVKLLSSKNDVIRELSVILLKALSLYQAQKVKDAIPPNLLILMEKDQSIPTGMMIINLLTHLLTDRLTDRLKISLHPYIIIYMCVYCYVVYGGEYGGLIEEYLQGIVENRRDMHYLLEDFTETDRDNLGLSQEMLTSYENTFMELDMNCSGALGEDEVKMLMVNSPLFLR